MGSVQARVLVDEEEFNQLDEIPPFATAVVPHFSPIEETPNIRRDHNEGIHVKKARKTVNLNFSVKFVILMTILKFRFQVI